MPEVEIDDISRIAKQARHYAYICPVEMKSLQIGRYGQVGVAPDDEEVFIEAADSPRQRLGELIIAMRVREAKRQAPRINAAAISTNAPTRVDAIEFAQDGVKFLATVVDQKHILMTYDDISTIGRCQELVYAPIGVILIFLRIIDINVLTVVVREAVIDKRINQLFILSKSVTNVQIE